MKTLYADQIIAWRPCSRYAAEHIEREYAAGKTAREIADRDIPIMDRLWVLEHWLCIAHPLDGEYGIAHYASWCAYRASWYAAYSADADAAAYAADAAAAAAASPLAAYRGRSRAAAAASYAGAARAYADAAADIYADAAAVGRRTTLEYLVELIDRAPTYTETRI